MNKGKKWGAAVLAAGVLLGGTGMLGTESASAGQALKSSVSMKVQQTGVSLTYNGKAISQRGKLVNGNTLIPLTVLRDTFGLPLSYTPSTHTYLLGTGITKMTLDTTYSDIGTRINGFFIQSKSADYTVKEIDGHLYVPFKLLNDYLGIQGVYHGASHSLDLSKRAQNPVQITSELISPVNKHANITISYPKLSGLANTAAQNSINTYFKQEADSFAAAAAKEAGGRSGKLESDKYEYAQKFVVTFNHDGVISVLTNQSSYTGGNHSNSSREGASFSLKDGKRLQLSDFLKSNPSYKLTLNQQLISKTKADGYTADFGGLKAAPDFFLREGGFAVFFQQYEIAPYAEGFPTYNFSFSDLLSKGTDPFAGLK